MMRKFKRRACSFFSIILVPYLHKKMKKKIQPGHQIFFITRMDMGSFVLLLDYAELWEKSRGKTNIVVLTSKYQVIEQLKKALTPNLEMITPHFWWVNFFIKLFGPYNVNDFLLYKVYGLLFSEYPYALRLYDPTLYSCYIPFFDERLKNANNSPIFIKSYKEARISLNYCERPALDYFYLRSMGALEQKKLEQLPFLKLKQNLKLQDPFVVFNINCKTYKEKGTVRKQILHPERYNCVIDRLIEKGFTVVLQGRNEQPRFQERKGLVDYSKSNFCSIENDVTLFAKCDFAIVNKTGPENFCTAVNTPQLGLNYSEHSNLTPNKKIRFFPKYLKKKGRYLSWKEFLHSPSFFDIGKNNFDPEIEYEDLNEEDMLLALEEFLILLKKQNWLELTELQKEFQKEVTPLHLDLHDTKLVPCETYLRKFL